MANIKGVKIIPLKRIMDERGCIYPMLRNDSKHFKQFGEIYFSEIFPNVIKGWHLHKKMTLNYVVIVGNIKLALYDLRQTSPTYGKLQEIYIGENNYCLVSVPLGVANGFKAVGDKRAIVANCSDIPHDPEEITRYEPFDEDIGYDWEMKHG